MREIEITGKRERKRAKLPWQKRSAQLPLYQRVFIVLSRGGFSPHSLVFDRPLSHSVCFRHLYFSFPLVDLPLSPMGLIPLARRHQSRFQKRIHGIGAAVVHSVVPIFLRSRPPPPLSFYSRAPRSFHPHCRYVLFLSRRHMWCSPLLAILPLLGSLVTCPLSIIESELKESPLSLPRKLQDIFLFAKIVTNFLETFNIVPNF